ncbi:MAG: diguanylate cyclase [Sandaracinus sp.]|nr:diguanylate cyclase [Sandaracinus sp.]MCB9632337.1 diguanylate cyclase [Sandaracinus sp.]
MPVVLVADDDRLVREKVGALLRGRGYAVELVGDGAAALERAAKGDVGLFLLDVLMPGLGGLEACRLLKSLARDREAFWPVVLLTAQNDNDSRVQGLRLGADDYVGKPFDERELLARVDGLLRIRAMHDELASAKQRLEALAVTDELTGLYNFRYLSTRLREELKRAERHREPLACAMLDVDRFKRINDDLGHDVGDIVLREVARRVRGAVREIDVVARYGGDELLLILPSTPFSGALTVASRVWNDVRVAPIRANGQEVRVTTSIGVALYPSRDVTDAEALLRAADQALYQAKRDGRDRIGVFQHEGYIFRP